MAEQRKRKSGGGRKSNIEKGLEPTITTGVRSTRTILDKCIQLHGSLANALIFASQHAPK